MPNAICLFCEDIREEKAGTDTIIGVFPDNLAIGSLPITLPRLGIYIRVHFDPKNDPGQISVTLVAPNGSEILKNDFQPEIVERTRAEAIANGAPVAGLISRLTAANFPVTEAGRVSVFVEIAGQKILAGALNFGLEIPKSAS